MVVSTLDGRTVLPHRIRWHGLPTLAPAKVKRVDFLIDGHVDWIERRAPYSYSDDAGYLVTSWLSPGRHRFTIRAIAVDGHTATDTVVARVLPPPEVPASLAGTWQRTVANTAGAPKPGSAGNPTETLTPTGKYTITFDRRWIHDSFPCTASPCRFDPKTGGGGMFDSDWTPRSGTFRVEGAVTIQVFHDSDRLGGWWCNPDGPVATYAWSVSGNKLGLAAVGGRDTCRIRGFIWIGHWTRVASTRPTKGN
jgi:hypothetical protein